VKGGGAATISHFPTLSRHARATTSAVADVVIMMTKSGKPDVVARA